jgi:hypothetical protein
VPDGFTVVRLEEIPEVPEPEPDDPQWKPVRHYLRLRSFGTNAFVAPDAGRRLVVDHVEEETGHEELYVVLTGRATFTIEGEEYDCPARTLVAIRDSSIRRYAESAEPGTTVLTVAGKPGEAYEISSWDRRWTSQLAQVEP